ncbi:type II toxin-antitoxin system RelE family toxin [Campylobacter sp. MIT 97-5078]|uniref:type II toxin-antitoxin system RelE family toxin n=1 Tax=Campylobacter sp. MIT 97-5078 TaxID=1548153 RepID=UPI000512ABA4|nr:type II toxin-antitoxin system RelE/ParE family toxin [Campylobacter sp. MIT 97-5078]KGI56956.1 hypothetical protein LR59_03720 [Campylobacter sp. MIT 97-5078]TQR22879.1 type II toxin-antitoxin system mRNA interferase toxin, RelE/StbE family [Campylobacter sp. MIT 97-5078]
MEIQIERKVNKYLEKQVKGDKLGVLRIKDYIENFLITAKDPTQLPQCKKLQGYENLYRWRVGNYRIKGEIREKELIILIIEISTRENAYK